VGRVDKVTGRVLIACATIIVILAVWARLIVGVNHVLTRCGPWFAPPSNEIVRVGPYGHTVPQKTDVPAIWPWTDPVCGPAREVLLLELVMVLTAAVAAWVVNDRRLNP